MEDAYVHSCDSIQIISRLNIDVQPIVELVWKINKRYWRRGYRLLGFRSTTGYGTNQYTHHYELYGSLILSIDLGKGQATPATNDHIEEGHYYYTFFVCRPGVLGLWHRYAGPVQFEKTVPSLDWRQQQVAKHHEMNSTVRKEEYDAIQHANRMTEAERKRDSLRDKKHTDPEKEHAVQKARDRQRRADRDQRFETDLETLRNSARYKNAPKAEQLALERTLRYDHSLREEDDLKP